MKFRFGFVSQSFPSFQVLSQYSIPSDWSFFSEFMNHVSKEKSSTMQSTCMTCNVPCSDSGILMATLSFRDRSPARWTCPMMTSWTLRTASKSSFILHKCDRPFSLDSARRDLSNPFPPFQIYQAVSLKTETEWYLRIRSFFNETTGEGLCMGALYWQLNDVWPGASWSSLEHGG